MKFFDSNIRYHSCNTTPLQSPLTSPIAVNREMAFKNNSNLNSSAIQQSSNIKQMDSEDKLIDALSKNTISPSTIQNHIKNKLNIFKSNMFTPPKMGKRKNILVTPDKVIDSTSSSKPQQQNIQSNGTPNLNTTDTKSWFQRFNFKNDANSLNPTNASNASEKEKEIYSFIADDKSINLVKNKLTPILLNIRELTFDMIEMFVYRCEYRHNKFGVNRNIKFKIEISLAENVDFVQLPFRKFLIKFILSAGSSSTFKSISQFIFNQYFSNQHKQTLNNLQASPIPLSRQQQQQQQPCQQYFPQSPQCYRPVVFPTTTPPLPASICLQITNTPTDVINNLSSASSTSTTSASSSSASSSSSSSSSSTTAGVYRTNIQPIPVNANYINYNDMKIITNNNYAPRNNAANYSFT